MTLKECRDLLGLEEEAVLFDVKAAYRRLAFALHPDLNPDVPDASRRFQELNEAYVTLSQALAEGLGARPPEHTAREREAARRAYEKARRAQGGKPRREAGSARTAKDQEKDKEEFLREILNDPFARRVFEDIYSHIRHEASPPAGAAKDARRPAAGKKEAPAAGKEEYSVFDGVKGWLRRQIDDEQVLRLPGDQIIPGARVRLHIRHGLSGDPQTVELTLPPEFAPGKAMRLKGMGRRIGGWRGDLYVRIEAD
ncbi:MAG: DnaJ domain-containing protein [Desulfovibrio sp.]|jgi:molecular chaperone DnaJ|nr:DnaJ domain-containing protein [Desulfovibrio sp.]